MAALDVKLPSLRQQQPPSLSMGMVMGKLLHPPLPSMGMGLGQLSNPPLPSMARGLGLLPHPSQLPASSFSLPMHLVTTGLPNPSQGINPSPGTAASGTTSCSPTTIKVEEPEDDRRWSPTFALTLNSPRGHRS